MNTEWGYVIDVAVLSLFLGIATYFKRKVVFFKKYLIPNSIIAGFIGLLAGPELLNIIKLDPERLGTLVYHLMAIGFISLALKERKRDKSKDVVNSGAVIVSTYLIQGILGFCISLVMAYTIYPDLFKAFGLLLPLGFGQGPGQAFSIGRQWEAIGFWKGGNIGISIGAIGFLWACLGGVPLMNYLVRKGKYKLYTKTGNKKLSAVSEQDSPDDIPLSESIDRISVQIFLIGIVYLTTYLTLKLLDVLLVNLGSMGETLSHLFWGFNFIIGALYAILLRIIFDLFKKKNIMTRNYPNNFLLQRIAGGSFDFMITAAISAISLSILNKYLLPTLAVTILGGVITMAYIIFICKKHFKSHIIESIVAFYAMLTGTISTGLALLREVDPEFETPVAKHLLLGSGVGLFLGFPLMILLTLPIMGIKENKPGFFIITLFTFTGYLAILSLLLLFQRKRRK